MTPFACTLTSPELRERKALIHDVLARTLIDRAPVQGGVRARFPAAPGVEAQLRELIDLERQCCPFLSMTLEPGGDAIVLEVTGPADAGALIAELFDARPTPRC